MKQVIRKGLKDIIVDEVPDPVVTPHHVIVRPLCSLISSGTETASIHQEGVLKEVADNPGHLRKIWNVMKAQGPLATVAEVRAKFSEYAVLGYSGAGVVIDKHSTVQDLSLGDRVAYGGEGTGHGEAILTGRNLVARVPDEMPFEQACFATLGAIALNAVRIAEISIGDVVAVIGQGLVGQLISQLARLQGGVVVPIDLKQDRVELAQRMGAERQSAADLSNGRGADCVIVAAAAKSAAPCRHALELCRDRGRIIVVGAVEMSFPWNEMYLKEVRLYMSRAYGPGSYDAAYEKKGQDYPVSYVRWTENRNMEEFLRLVAQGRVDVRPLITHQFPLDEAASAYETILDPSSGSLAVLLKYPEKAAALKTRVDVTASTPQAAIRVGLAGAGNLARWAHLPILKKMEGVSLQAIYSANGARGKSYALRFGAAYCCSDYKQILEDSAINVVIITTRNAQHAAQAIAALRAGKHVFVEKPLALTEEECSEITRASAESGKQLSVGFNRRFAPDYVELKKHLARRTGPAVINARISSPGISGSYWMAGPDEGGAILGEACHFVDLMYWLLGSEPVSVYACSLPSGKQHPIGENNLAASFRFADGSVGNLTYCTVGSSASAGERVEVFADGIGASTEDFKRFTSGGTRTRWFADKGYKEQLEAFFSSLRTGELPPVTVRDGVRATIGCLRMLDSARSGGPSAIEWEA